MLILPRMIISALIFPGVIVHEIAHRLFADWAGVPVFEICYFRFGYPAGYLVLGPSKSLSSTFLIAVGPFIVNTALCAVLTFSAVFPLYILDAQHVSWVYVVLMWVGVSIGMCAFPSDLDTQLFLDEVKETKRGGPLLVAAKCFAGLFRVVNVLRIFLFDLLYAFSVPMILPWLLRYY